jgi:hypothetical protein
MYRPDATSSSATNIMAWRRSPSLLMQGLTGEEEQEGMDARLNLVADVDVVYALWHTYVICTHFSTARAQRPEFDTITN